MSPTQLYLEVSYVRNSKSTFRSGGDLDYLRKRINTNRSSNTSNMSVIDNHYYEGAKTLVDVFGIIFNSSPIDVDKIQLRIGERDHHCAILNAQVVSLVDDVAMGIELEYSEDDEYKGTFTIRFKKLFSDEILFSDEYHAGQILNYSENFPTPSVMEYDMREAIFTTVTKLKEEGNNG